MKTPVLTVFVFVAIIGLVCRFAKAQEDSPPQPDGEAVAVSAWAPMAEAKSEDGETTTKAYTTKERVVRRYEAYYSPTFRCHLVAQWMYIQQSGRPVNFWGARIVSLGHDSPLRQLGLNPGDVITRLDGIQIWRGMYREAGRPWNLVEFENHYGRTESATSFEARIQVRVGDVLLDGTIHDGFDDVAPIKP